MAASQTKWQVEQGQRVRVLFLRDRFQVIDGAQNTPTGPFTLIGTVAAVADDSLVLRSQVMPGLPDGGRRSSENSFTAFEPFFVTLKEDPAIERIRPGAIREYLLWRRVHRVRKEGEGEERVVVAV